LHFQKNIPKKQYKIHLATINQFNRPTLLIMKNFVFTLLAAISFAAANAQPKFNSTAYTQFYNNRWEKLQYAPDTAEVNLTTDQKIAGLSKAWAEAKYNFANFDLIAHTNWDSVYQTFIPRVVAASNTEAYYKVLQQFYQNLRDGHSGIGMPARYWDRYQAALPLEFGWVEGKVIVTKNTSTDKADANIKAGMEVIRFNGQPVLEYIQKEISPYLSFSTPQDSTERIYRYELMPGKKGSSAAFTFRTAAGKPFSQTVKRVPAPHYFDRFPLAYFTVLKDNIGYLQINSFNDTNVVKIFDSIFSAISKTDALVIDIRNNGGGNGNNGFEILGCLSAKPFFIGKTALRRYFVPGREWGNVEQIEIIGDDWKPYKGKLYAKPIVLLTGAATYSAAEDFTSAFRSISRGKVFGTATGGSTGQPVSFGLPGGGFGRVCAKRDYLWDGTEFVGIGIQPDVLVRPTIKGIAAGKDEVLEAAVKFLVTKPATALK
jgi:carboxyl-terminal processing protease